MTKEYIASMKFLDSGEIYTEMFDAPEGADPTEYMRQAVIDFNAEEKRRHAANPKYCMSLREFIAVDGATGTIFCNCWKVNLMSVSKGRQLYDVYQCRTCKIYYQRFGLEYLPKTKCTPDLVCRECNRVFKSKAILKNHNAKGKHTAPNWLPDGV